MDDEALDPYVLDFHESAIEDAIAFGDQKKTLISVDRLKKILCAFRQLRELHALVKSIVTQTGDDVCWRDWRGNYEQMAQLVGVEFRPELLDKPTMMRNCERFYDCLTNGEHYATPEPAADLSVPCPRCRKTVRSRETVEGLCRLCAGLELIELRGLVGKESKGQS